MDWLEVLESARLKEDHKQRKGEERTFRMGKKAQEKMNNDYNHLAISIGK